MDSKHKRNISIGVGVLFVLLLVLTGRSNKSEDVEVEYAEALSGKFVISIEVAGTLEAENSMEIKGPDIQNSRNVRAQSLSITDIITEGTTVRKGDYVATLDKTEFQNTLSSYQEDLDGLLIKYEASLIDTAVKLSGLRDNIINQKHAVENARTTLVNSKFESSQTIRTAELNLLREENSLAQLYNSYELSKRQIDKNLNNSRISINRMRDRITDYETILNSFVITAPADGMVVYAKDFRGSKIKSGSSINMMESVVATLPDLSSMMSRVHVSEIDVNKLAPGMNVQIIVDAFPSKMYTGKVTSVAKVGETLANSDSKVFEVYIKMDKVDAQLRPDMTTTNTIQIASFDNVVYVPNESVHTGTDSVTVVYTKSGKKQVVVLGSSNSDNVIVEQGLEAGETIYLSMPTKIHKFKLVGEELIEVVKQQNTARARQNNGIPTSEVKGIAGL